MNKHHFKCVLLFAAAVTLHTTQAQIPTANSFSSQLNYNGIYRYGINLGWFPGWSVENNATIAAGNAEVRGAGLRTYRTPLYDDFLTNWGLDVELEKFRTFASLGADDHTAMVGQPSPAHRDTVTFPGSPERSKSFLNIYDSIWLDSAKTQINPNNYYAKYLYDVIATYGQYIKFWEVMNEPDFTWSSAGWMDTWMYRDPTPEELPNLRAPIYYYVRMLRVSWEVIKRFQPDDFVCVGGLGYRGFLDAAMRNTDNPVDGSITEAYPLKGGAYFDVISYHNYPMYDIRRPNRNSDHAAAAFIAARNRMDDIAVNHGYNGTQYPRKQSISTETGLSRFTHGDNWGSNEGQKNYAIKASVIVQKNAIHQVYWFSLSDGPDPDNQHDRMGLFYYLGDTTPYNQTPTDQGKAFTTTTDLLYGKRYDAVRTAALALPPTVDGGAFRADDGTYTYVIWAKTILDMDETATAVYSFPSAVIARSSVVRKEWDFAYTNDSVTISKTGILLTGSPSFFTEGGNLLPVVNAGADLTITLPLNTITLTGSGTDEDGTITSFAWAQVSGPNAAGILSPLQASTPVTNLVRGEYQFEFRVTDNGGAEARDTVQVTVNAAPVTTRIEAEAYLAQSGTQNENTSDAGGGQNVGWIDIGDWMDYTVNVDSAGIYTVNLRVASLSGSDLQIKNSAGTVLATVTVPNTGSWQAWQTVTANIALAGGSQTVRLYASGSGWNINWWEIAGAFNPSTVRIEAENYTSQYGTQAENTSDIGGGQNIGYIDAGDWLEYNINPSVTGTYTLNFRIATQNPGGQIQIKKADGTLLGSLSVPVTGGWQNWQTISTAINLTAGNQAIRIYSGNGNWNINWLEYIQGGTLTLRIEAEDYTNQQGVQKEPTSDDGGGQNVGYIDMGDWMDYTVNADSAGIYAVHLRVASLSGSELQIKDSAGTVMVTVNIPATGAWQSWQTVTANILLAAGSQTVRVYAIDGGWNINWWEARLSSTTTTRIEAEFFSDQSGTQNENTSDAGGGQNVGYIDIGDWMDYDMNVSAAGTYTVNLRMASPSGGNLQIRDQAGNVLASVNVPNTGGWQTWQTVTTRISLEAGSQTLQIYASGNGWNMNWWELAGAAVSTSSGVRIEAENYSSMSGIQTEGTSDAGGGQNIGWIDTGDWMDYNVDLSEAGTYTVKLRVASPLGGILEIRNSSGLVLATVNVPATGAWQSWETVTAIVILPAGHQTLRIHAASGGWNLNWWEIGSFETIITRASGNKTGSTALKIYPSMITNRFQLRYHPYRPD